jgi:hypothetical protein
MLTALLGLAALVGWGQSGEERFLPPPERAEAALELVLDAWRNAQDQQQLFELATSSESVQVHITDSHRKVGQRLADFRILGEVLGRKPRYYTVQLDLENPKETQKVRFVIVGIDPIWIFREDDYDMLTHWHHPIEEKDKDPVTESDVKSK